MRRQEVEAIIVDYLRKREATKQTGRVFVSIDTNQGGFAKPQFYRFEKENSQDS